ncbi:MAG: electron transfer flavoprotein subunit alpha/FixB family protein [Synergistaceae bacterium]|jgi:electron transfer flavoprotein alpha subunit|nr:electron transfer flavoprotein subunit alpha/FixB family protein [Synergistaceae bacterium]
MSAEIENFEVTRIAVVVFASERSFGRTGELLAGAAHFAALAASWATVPPQTELWLLGEEYLDEALLLPVDVICHVTLQEPRLCSAEEWMPALTRLYQRRRPQAVLFCSDLAGNELAVRLAVRVGGSCMTEVSSFSMNADVLTVARGAYGSNLTAHFDMEGPWVLSIAKGAFESLHKSLHESNHEPLHEPTREPTQDKGTPEIITLVESLSDGSWHKGLELRREEAEEGIESAEVAVIGGRGVGNRENMERMRRLAGLMNGRLGGTRPAVLDAWLKHKDLVGASGNLIRPRLCLAMGVSGSGPFMAGVEKSGVLAAVNNDPDALIFKYCDVGVVEDCNAIASELERILMKERQMGSGDASPAGSGAEPQGSCLD